MAQPFYAVIIPLGGGHPDQGLPGGPETQPPGVWPGPGYPDQGLPGRPGRPPHVGNRPPGSWDRPEYPSTGPVRPGRPVDPSWGVEEEGPGHPDQGLPPGPAHPWVPPEGETLPPPPDEIVDQVVLAIWRPEAQAWTVKTAPPVHPAPHR